jgi:hypothetical protein
MTQIDKAIAILGRTNDGNLLSPADLKLVEIAANDGLSHKGAVSFEALSQAVGSGDYFKTPQWFHGIENLTRDHEGYVYWKGRHVEHYSFREADEERVAAQELAATCRKLETLGFPVTSRNLSESCYDAPADTPWKLALQYFYSFFERNGVVIGIFYLTDRSDTVVCLENVQGKFVRTSFDSAYTAFHAMQDSGATSMSCQPSYLELAERLTRMGMPANELNAELSGIWKD